MSYFLFFVELRNCGTVEMERVRFSPRIVHSPEYHDNEKIFSASSNLFYYSQSFSSYIIEDTLNYFLLKPFY